MADATRLVLRDVSHAGHELGRAEVEGLPPSLTLGELIHSRIHAEVARYNRSPGPVFEGLVQPADAIRHREGHHLASPRPLDADLFVAAAREAVASGILWFVVDGEDVTDLDHRIEVGDHDLLEVVLRRPVIAAAG